MKKTVHWTELDLKEETVVKISRVAKTVKGGRRIRFNAIVTVGNGNGYVGVGLGKANQVIDAVNKGKEDAKRNIVYIPLKGRTIEHQIVGKNGAGKVLLRPATPGTGVIAGGPVRAIMDQVGIHDILAKNLGSNNAHNIVKATIDALRKLHDPLEVAAKRGKKISEIYRIRK